MKTISIRQNKYSKQVILVLMSVLVVSCGSYQNASYFDRDGIYGNASQQSNVVTAPDNTNNSNQYKNYFESLQDPAAKKDSTFTDVERYSSDQYNDQDSRNNNSIWGGDSGTTVVNIYDNNWGWNNWGWGNYWNWNIGWGWDPWFGPNWGWGWGWNSWYGNPWWGWGWNSWYGNPMWGGYYQPYHHGTRSFSRTNRAYTNAGTRNYDGRRSIGSDIRSSRNNFDGRRSEPVIRNPRSISNFNSGGNPVRNNTNQPNTTPRSNPNSSPRFQNSSSRNYNTPRNNSSSNGSYNSGGRSSGGSYGGGRSSGGSYGGGRSFGGGRR